MVVIAHALSEEQQRPLKCELVFGGGCGTGALLGWRQLLHAETIGTVDVILWYSVHAAWLVSSIRQL